LARGAVSRHSNVRPSMVRAHGSFTTLHDVLARTSFADGNWIKRCNSKNKAQDPFNLYHVHSLE
jgi:hypothetical protein